MEGVPANEFYCSRRLRRRECGVQPSSHSSWFTSPPTAACEAGKEEFFSPPPHTTGHAGPHPAVSGYFTELFRFVKDGVLRMRRKVAQPYGFNTLCEQHKALPCTGFGPSPCPHVSTRRLTTMASADSCLLPAGFFDFIADRRCFPFPLGTGRHPTPFVVDSTSGLP